MAFYAAAFIGVAIVARLLVDTQGLPEWVFGGALVVMALGFPVILFTGYTQYVARKVAQATPTLTPRGTLVRPSANGTMAQLAVKASPHVSWARTARGGIAALTAFALLVAGYLVLRALGIGPSGSLLAAGQADRAGPRARRLVRRGGEGLRARRRGGGRGAHEPRAVARGAARVDERDRRRARADAEAGVVARGSRAGARDRAARGDQGGRERQRRVGGHGVHHHGAAAERRVGGRAGGVSASRRRPRRTSSPRWTG